VANIQGIQVPAEAAAGSTVTVSALVVWGFTFEANIRLTMVAAPPPVEDTKYLFLWPDQTGAFTYQFVMPDNMVSVQFKLEVNLYGEWGAVESSLVHFINVSTPEPPPEPYVPLIQGVQVPTEAAAGSTVTVSALVVWDVDYDANISLQMRAAPPLVDETKYMYVGAGQTAAFTFQFIMPNNVVSVIFTLFVRREAVWEELEMSGFYSIQGLPPVPEPEPDGRFLSIFIETPVESGAIVYCHTLIKNIAEITGDLRVRARWTLNGSEHSALSEVINAEPNTWRAAMVEFTMPSKDIIVDFDVQHIDPIYLWWKTDETWTGYYVECIPVTEWFEIKIPDWMLAVLETGALNLEKGEWFDQLGVKIPPFSFTPGYWIRDAINSVLGPINTIVNLIRVVLDTKITMADFLDDIHLFEPFATLFTWVETAHDFVSDFGGEVIEFVQNPFDYLCDKIEFWLYEEVDE